MFLGKPTARTISRLRCALTAITILSALALGSPANAQEALLQLDPAKTEVNFTLTGSVHTVHGNFRLKSGTVRFNAASGEAGGEVAVDATSGDSGSGLRDRRMHREILESGKYPEFRFAPAHVRGTIAPQGKSQVQVEGKLALHGGEHDISLPFKVEISGDQVSATTHFVIPYVDWGLKNPSTLFLRVGHTVNIDIRTSGKLTPALPQ